MSINFKSAPDLKLLQSAGRAAGVRALNLTIVTIRKEAQLLVRKELKIKAGDAKLALTIKKASTREPSATLSLQPQGVSLAAFGARKKIIQTARGPRIGVTVQVKGERKLVQGGFLARLNGKLSIFRRKTSKRFPIEKLYGPSPYQLLSPGKLMETLKVLAKERLQVVFDRESKFYIQRALDKRAAKAANTPAKKANPFL